MLLRTENGRYLYVKSHSQRIHLVSSPTQNLFALTIPNPSVMNLNSKLMEQIVTRITVGVSNAGDRLCLREDAASGYKLAKGGSIKDKRLIQHIVNVGVRLPARYTVWKEEACWLAALDEHFPPTVNMDMPPSKPRKRNLKHLLVEEKTL